MAETLTIETRDLSKTYGHVEAVRGLTLQVPRGSIFGFLGRNGAGKTTTIKALLNIVRPTSGQVRVFDLPAEASDASVEIRRRTGFVSEDKELYDFMTVGEMIRFTSAFYPKWRRDLEQKYLQSFALPLDQRVKTLSRGTRTKLALLLVLARGAELLILDEPTSGLDPAVAEEVLQALITHVASEEMTVFFSSHQIAEVDQVADRVAIMNRGRLVVTGPLDDLRESYRRVQLIFDADAPETSFHAPGVIKVERKGRVLTVLTSAGSEPILAEAQRLHPSSVNVLPVTLKEIFLESVAAEN